MKEIYSKTSKFQQIFLGMTNPQNKEMIRRHKPQPKSRKSENHFLILYKTNNKMDLYLLISMLETCSIRRKKSLQLNQKRKKKNNYL